MIKNLLLVALRNFKRDKWYSLLNILGLTIGISFSLFLVFYIKDELSYDRYHKKADRIYRISSHIKERDKDTIRVTATPFLLGPVLKKEFPEVEEAVRIISNDKKMYKNGDLHFFEDKVFTCDSNLFRVFSYEFIEGNPQTALVEPHSMVLTESVSEKYFGKTHPVVGKTLQNDRGDIYKITAVVKDVPKNSHLIFHILISETTLSPDFSNDWGQFSFYTYVLLRPHADAGLFEKKLLPLYDKYLARIFTQFNIQIRFGVQPITAIHLHSDMLGEPEELGNISYVYIFSAVALFMLIIACINYMNLTTARSAKRGKEIGIRKVAGSSRWQLALQFLAESMLTAFLSLLLSLCLVAWLLPLFNSLSGKSISFNILFEPATFFILLAIVLFVGLLGGSYPAFYLSNFNPIGTLKGSLSKSSGNTVLRRILVVVQFTVSMTLLICTRIVADQMSFIRSKDLGFNKEQVLSLTAHSNYDIREKIIAFKNEIRKYPDVVSSSTSDNTPGNNTSMNIFSVQTKNGFTEKGVDFYAVDEDYFKTLGIQIKRGRGFVLPSDTLKSIIVNESMVKYFGWDDAIGKKIRSAGDTAAPFMEVVGVIKDFNQKSLYNPITPLILTYQPGSREIQAKLDPKNIPAALAGIRKSWNRFFPELPFSYTFLDQDFDSQYAADQKRGKLFTSFSILTILITCLGLLGLIAFTTEQRQKEISIRKVMGAGVGEIIPLITRNFILLLTISCLLAFPVAWLFMDKWLTIFQYKISLTPAPFILSALTILLMTLLTVTFHTVKAAVANPMKGLRTE